eukprot:766366_1
MSLQDYPKIKCLLLGSSAVGKTCMCISYTIGHYIPSAGEYPDAFPGEHHSANIMWNGNTYSLTIVDSMNEYVSEGDNQILEQYSDVNVILLCFSIIDKDSFDEIKNKWYQEAQDISINTPIILVRTKIDEKYKMLRGKSAEERADMLYWSAEDAETCAHDIGAISYVENSALTQRELKYTFDEVLRVAFQYDPGLNVEKFNDYQKK